MFYESIFQHLKITWKEKTWNINCQCFLYTEALFFEIFSLWIFLQCYDITWLFAMESQESQAFIYAKIYMTSAAGKNCFPFAPFQLAPLCIFGTHKDWPVILLVKALVVRDICDLYFFWIWDAYFHITITGVIVTSGIANKHRTYFARNSM